MKSTRLEMVKKLEMVEKLAKELRNYIFDNFTKDEIKDLDLFDLMMECNVIQYIIEYDIIKSIEFEDKE